MKMYQALRPLVLPGPYLLDNNTISESAFFLRDFLKKDYIFCIFKAGHYEKDLKQ